MKIRNAIKEDIRTLANIEAACFPAAEAASYESFVERFEVFPECFFVAEQNGEIIGFIDGMVTDSKILDDEMFDNTSLHNPHEAYQSVFGINTLPEYRAKGVGTALMNALIEAAKSKGCKGVILTCKKELIPFYEPFGYKNLGLSKSQHGGAVWFDMILTF